MTMADFTKFVALLATMSVAVERAVEVLKGFIPFLNQKLDPGTKENIRRAVLQVIAVLCGTIVAYMGKDQIANIEIAKNLISMNGLGYVLIGLLTAGGSAFWNHVLDLIGALKTQQEKTAAMPAGAPAAPAAAAAGAGK